LALKGNRALATDKKRAARTARKIESGAAQVNCKRHGWFLNCKQNLMEPRGIEPLHSAIHAVNETSGPSNSQEH
jgi:hypothetical protein